MDALYTQRFLAIFALAGLLCGCLEINPRADDIAALDGDSDRGEIVYITYCGACHGADLKSGTEDIDIASELSAGEDKYITWILDGTGDMPGFGDRVTDQQVADLLVYIRAQQ